MPFVIHPNAGPPFWESRLFSKTHVILKEARLKDLLSLILPSPKKDRFDLMARMMLGRFLVALPPKMAGSLCRNDVTCAVVMLSTRPDLQSGRKLINFFS